MEIKKWSEVLKMDQQELFDWATEMDRIYKNKFRKVYAEHAGITTSTIGKHLNNNGVSFCTREKVYKIVKEDKKSSVVLKEVKTAPESQIQPPHEPKQDNVNFDSPEVLQLLKAINMNLESTYMCVSDMRDEMKKEPVINDVTPLQPSSSTLQLYTPINKVETTQVRLCPDIKRRLDELVAEQPFNKQQVLNTLLDMSLQAIGK